MSYIISLQGGMAAGKTTLAKKLSLEIPDLVVSFENPSEVISIIKDRNLNKNILEDFLEIQKMFIAAEIKRYNALSKYNKVLIDLGPEEIEFYTLHYPKTINAEWNIEKLLSKELDQLRACRLNKIIFLDATKESLQNRKANDKTRRRGFFDHYLNHLYEYKRDWFKKKENVVFMNVSKLTTDEVFNKAKHLIQELN